jgi:hypothetical protein
MLEHFGKEKSEEKPDNTLCWVMIITQRKLLLGKWVGGLEKLVVENTEKLNLIGDSFV